MSEIIPSDTTTIFHERCLICGRFAVKITDDIATPNKPVGSYCASCDWHSMKKCRLDEVLSKELQQIVMVAPMNAVVRAQILASCLVSVPDDNQDFESIKHWIEFNVTKPARRTLPNPECDEDDEDDDPGIPDSFLEINVRVTCNEVGRCDYSIPKTGISLYEINENTIRRILDDVLCCGGGMSSFLGEILHEARSIVEDNMPEMRQEEDADIEYDDYSESEESPVNLCISISEVALQDRLRNWLYNFAPQDLLMLTGEIPNTRSIRNQVANDVAAVADQIATTPIA
jgi:hypothetical protein